MMNTLAKLWRQEDGFVLSTEMVLVGSLAVVGMVVGLTSVRNTVVQELDDFSKAVGSLDQSYWYSPVWGHCAWTAGSGYRDRADFSDRHEVVICGHTVVCASAFGPTAHVGAGAAVYTTPTYVAPPHPVPLHPQGVHPGPVRPVPEKPVPPAKPAPSRKRPSADQGARVPPVPAAPAGTVVLGAPNLAPLSAWAEQERPRMRVLLDPTRQGPYLLDAPEGSLNAFATPGQCPNLQMLVGSGAGFIDVGHMYGPCCPSAAPLPGHRHPEEITLGFTTVSDDELKNLDDVESVICLHILSTEVTDAGLAHLRHMNNLEELHILGTKITDDGLAHLRELRSLARLHLLGTRITGAGLAHLEGMPNLAVLDLRGTAVTPEALHDFQKAMPRVQVIR